MTIGDVGRQYGLSIDTLRYYERIGLIPPVRRGKGGVRDYSEDDLRKVEFIKHLRHAGVSIEVLIEYVRLVQMGDETVATREKILQAERDRLAEKVAELQKTLDILDYKVKNYRNIILEREKRMWND
jgi:DNA-binding transcriptional MerR regulator